MSKEDMTLEELEAIEEIADQFFNWEEEQPSG